MATVYRAHDTALNRAVAIKVLDPALAIDPRAVERFRREAVTSANLEHPSIVRVYDVEQSGTLHYIAMRYVQGTTLRDILRDNGPLAIESIVGIVKSIASALHYAHRHGVIHRDVKPGNILVEPDGTVLLTDFGIARAADNAQSALTATGHVMGTADYLAPEQISGRPAEARSDVYSLGVVLYEMLTGVTPFAGEHTATVLYRQVHDNPPPLRSVNPRLPAELQPVVDRALAKNPSLRYADPLDLARDLEEAAQWLPAGSPWLNRRPGTPNVLGNGAGGPRRLTGPLGPSTGIGGHTQPPRNRPSSRPYEKPRPYTSEEYQYAPAAEAPRAVITPPSVGRRGTLVLAGALALLTAGLVLLALATGVFGRGQPPGAQRFAEPGPRTYNGPPREGNGPDISIPLALVPPVIDGNLDDWAGAAPGPFPAPHITYEKGREWGGPDDLGAEFNFAWDSSNFYVAVVVTDNVHVQTTRTRGGDLFKGDDIEIWFDTDLAGDFVSREGNADDFQLGLSPGDFEGLAPEAYFWNPDRKPERIRLVTVAARPREGGTGYTLEAAMPWQALGEFRPQPGMAIGFAASAGDNDQPEVAIQELMISTSPNLEYKAPLTFGNLFF
jgi:serine/threonine protein kinase